MMDTICSVTLIITPRFSIIVLIDIQLLRELQTYGYAFSWWEGGCVQPYLVKSKILGPGTGLFARKDTVSFLLN